MSRKYGFEDTKPALIRSVAVVEGIVTGYLVDVYYCRNVNWVK